MEVYRSTLSLTKPRIVRIGAGDIEHNNSIGSPLGLLFVSEQSCLEHSYVLRWTVCRLPYRRDLFGPDRSYPPLPEVLVGFCCKSIEGQPIQHFTSSWVYQAVYVALDVFKSTTEPDSTPFGLALTSLSLASNKPFIMDFGPFFEIFIINRGMDV